jgi:hypothetical protein
MERRECLNKGQDTESDPETSGRWHAKLGNTLCIRPGQLTPFTYVTIDLATMEFERRAES